MHTHTHDAHKYTHKHTFKCAHTHTHTHMQTHIASDFSVRLTPTTNGTAHIFATLPARIPGSFSLVVQFSFNPENRAVKEILSPSLKDTDTIDIIIPREKLPSFKTFRIMVAIKSNGVQGDFSGESEPISK